MRSNNKITIELRKAVPADIPAIMSLLNEFARYVKKPDLVSATEQMLEQDLFGDTPKANVILGCKNEKAIAFALYFYTYASFQARPRLYLEDLYVTPKMRGQGVGTTVLKHLSKTAMDNGCLQFHWSALKWNKPALDFYASIGAVQDTETISHCLMGDALHRMAN